MGHPPRFRFTKQRFFIRGHSPKKGKDLDSSVERTSRRFRGANERDEPAKAFGMTGEADGKWQWRPKDFRDRKRNCTDEDKTRLKKSCFPRPQTEGTSAGGGETGKHKRKDGRQRLKRGRFRQECVPRAFQKNGHGI
ncbi:hypothetical protein B4135_3296 [Caldibacillus debilis]|uniref:Uncharacterized protein n=1 Tax=Caldibacillus debilis TaxID=301148 RepID=A0A150LFS5_9BACI|nr:hypothetical protein B4135_3296 [Caldibacillus debilis]